MFRQASSKKTTHWTRTRRLSLILLAAWSGLTFPVIFFARELSQFTFFGWPVSFYMAAQGCVLGYLLLTGVYALAMDRADNAASGNTVRNRESHGE